MEKVIKIGTKEFKMKSSAYTQFKYKNETGKSLIKDLSTLGKQYESIDISKEDAIEQFDSLDEFITTALRIAYIMSMEAKSYTGTFEDYLKEIDNYLEDVNWIGEVVELAISPLSRNIQTT